MPRYFTVEEANAALVIIRPLIARLLEIREWILARQPELWSALEKAGANGGSKTASQTAQQLSEMQTILERVHTLGAVIKDLNVGLVDFPALRDGREVYLCWRYNEETVEYWHEIDAGFAGRQPL